MQQLAITPSNVLAGTGVSNGKKILTNGEAIAREKRKKLLECHQGSFEEVAKLGRKDFLVPLVPIRICQPPAPSLLMGFNHDSKRKSVRPKVSLN